MSSGSPVQIKHALQEWQAVCQALATGACSVLLRKGGIHDRGGLFQPEQERFALMPTYLHQAADRVRDPALVQEQPSASEHLLSHWAEVQGVWRCEDLEQLLSQAATWPWTDAEISKRFQYRDKPFLYVLCVRVYAFAEPQRLADDPSFAGCKSWLPLPQNLGSDRSRPVLDETALHKQWQHFAAELH